MLQTPSQSTHAEPPAASPLQRNKRAATILSGAIGALVVLAATACAPVTSSVPNPKENVAGERGMRGVAYFLPQPRVHLQVFETVLTRIDKVPVVAGGAGGGQPGGQAAGQVAPAPPAAPAGNPGAPQGFEPLPNTPPPPTKDVIVEEGRSYSFKIVKSFVVPDSSQQFMLRYHPSLMADDDFNVKVGTDGLLTKVKMTADDKTDEFVIKLIDVAKELSKSPLLFGDEPLKAQPVPVLVYEATFNPFTDCAQITHELNRRISGHRLGISLDEVGNTGKTYQRAFETTKQRDFSGVAFRPVLPYTLKCSVGSKVVLREPLLLPDPNQICTFPIGRASFVKKVTDLTFEHGILTEVTVNKPSEALAFVEIPLALAKALTEIPANIVQVKLNNTKNAASSAEEQIKLLDAQKRLIEAQAALDKVQQPQPQPQSEPKPLPQN